MDTRQRGHGHPTERWRNDKWGDEVSRAARSGDWTISLHNSMLSMNHFDGPPFPSVTLIQKVSTNTVQTVLRVLEDPSLLYAAADRSNHFIGEFDSSKARIYSREGSPNKERLNNDLKPSSLWHCFFSLVPRIPLYRSCEYTRLRHRYRNAAPSRRCKHLAARVEMPSLRDGFL